MPLVCLLIPCGLVLILSLLIHQWIFLCCLSNLAILFASSVLFFPRSRFKRALNAISSPLMVNLCASHTSTGLEGESACLAKKSSSISVRFFRVKESVIRDESSLQGGRFWLCAERLNEAETGECSERVPMPISACATLVRSFCDTKI